MKKTIILIINFYQTFISSLIHQLTGTKDVCRFDVTCSQYAKNSIYKFGVLKGAYLSFIRILKCQPFYKTV